MPYRRAAEHIYRDTRTGRLYERPKVSGRWTWRRLQARTLRVAQEELHARRLAQVRAAAGLERDPYGPPPATVRAILARFAAAGCPTVKLGARPAYQVRLCLRMVARLDSALGLREAEALTVADCVAYVAKRAKTRAADAELTLLWTACRWAQQTGLMLRLPEIARRPVFHSVKRHCRDCMPASALELHSLAAALLEVPASAPLGFQALLEAFTGCRTSEVLGLRWDAPARGAGWIEGGHLWLARAKGGVNPWAVIHPALASLLDVLRAWRRLHPAGPWFIPGKVPGQPMARDALTNALRRLAPHLSGGQPRTSHGLRAYYVTVRRSQGVADAQIAAEIGDASGAGIIASTYGSIPPNWQGDEAHKLTWLPTAGEPAWSVLDLPENVLLLANAL